ncbi:MAG TPA: amino acid adenylation domain-containing protein [Planctomycetaceae bacterium]|nr:amino acid adenylation domain-containing protein [Planctomycetaceae bacterium]
MPEGESAVTLVLRHLSESDDQPPSFEQERLWFLDQLEGDQALYGTAWGLRLRGGLNVAVLERSLREIVRRHRVLRTTFAMTGGALRAVLRDSTEFSLLFTDLRSLPPSDREVRAHRLASEEAAAAFDLSRDLLLRARLLQLSDEEYWLILTLHLTVRDSLSVVIFNRELAALYAAFSADQPSPLPDLPLQYVDCAAWERARFAGPELEEQVAYWKRQLARAPALLELPTDRPRQVEASYRGALEHLPLDEKLAAGLRELSRREGVTLFTILLAAFQVLLMRHSGETDISVATTVKGRPDPQLDGLIGFFENVVVLRGDLSGDPSFRDFVRTSREVVEGASVHGGIPFSKLLEELRPPRSLSYLPLCQVMLRLNAQQPTVQLANVATSPLRVSNGRSAFDLTLSLTEVAGSLVCEMEYRTDLFDACTIQSMLAHFRVLLESIVEQPEDPISKLPLLTTSERHQLLVEWNETQIDYPKERCIPALFEEQVARTPEAVAVVFETQRLTYRELNARANRLAHHLIGLGVGPETLVGLCIERSLEMVVGLVAILKAGGAYLPLDPEYPRQRLDETVADAMPSVLLSTTALSKRLAPAARVIALDAASFEASLSEASDRNPCDADRVAPLRPKCPAYVIYTSGSSGRPKGAVIEHHSLVNHMAWMCHAYPLNERDRVLARTSINFDASVWELWLPLLSGASLCVASEETARDPYRLANYMDEQGVTIAQFVPTLLSAVRSTGAGRPAQLRMVFAGGEPLAADLAEKVAASWQVPIINLYGPTETTIQVTHYRYEQGAAVSTTVPIGAPIGNARMYVLDDRLEPVPVGVTGELYIGGEGVGRGYLNRPELTSEKFLPDHLSGQPDARMYRSGDLVRWRRDGNLEFVGRRDNQVKLRGFRIELGEIEAVLARHPQVQRAVVIVREDRFGNPSLVAYVVPTLRQGPSITDLRNFLGQTLPAFMLPSAFVTLHALPLTPNGKVDRKELPAPETVGQALAGDYVAPQTAVQEQLAQIWSSVLSVQRVGTRDNFFVLGGDSLMAAEAMLRLRNVCGCDLPLRSLFEAPTIGELASLIERDSNMGAEGEGDLTSATRFHGIRGPTHQDNGRLSRDDLTEKLESIWIRGSALDPNDFCDIVRTGAGGVPIVCVGDARPIPFLLARLSNSVPIVQLKFDGVHVWPPYYLNAANQTDVYVHALEHLCVDKRAAILGWSYGGTLAYRLGLALQERGWSQIGVFVIEPDTPMPFLPFGRYQVLKRHFRQALTALYRGKDLRLGRPHSTLAPQVNEPKDRYARWDLMVGHYQTNIDSVRPRPFRRPMALVGSESYTAHFADAWRRVAQGSFEQCVFSNTDNHAACFLEARCTDQWLSVLEHWYTGIWGPTEANATSAR